MRVISQNVVHGMFAVTVDTTVYKHKIGDVVKDNTGREFAITSVAMDNSHEDTTFILKPIDGKMNIGEYVE